MPRRRRVNRDLRELRERKYRLQAKGSKFIPAPDSDFAWMARTFANHVAEHAERFAVSQEQAAALASAVEHYREALCGTMRPESAGPRATSLKNSARAKAEKIVRAAARTIRGAAGENVTDVDRLMLNMHERPQRLKARHCPQIAPVLRFIRATHGDGDAAGAPPRHVLEYGNDFDLGSSAKPHGAVRVELFVELVPVGAKPPVHPAQLSGGKLWYVRSYSTSRFEVEFPVMSDGTPMLVVYWGRWADSRGNVGPFSKTCAARIEGGPLPELVYVGINRPRLALPGAGVSRKIQATEMPMLEAGERERAGAHAALPMLAS